MSDHYCPKVNRIASTGYASHPLRFRNLLMIMPVKWVFSRID